MIRQKKYSTLVLAGVSFVALTMATGTVKAAGQNNINGNFPSWSVLLQGNGNNDFLEFDGFDSTGNVIIDDDIGGVPNNGTGIIIDNSVIGGNLLVEVDVYVTGNESDIGAGNVQATGAGIVSGYVFQNSQIEGSIVNDGLVAGYAEAISTADLGGDDDAEAYAFGIVTIGDDDPSVDNNGEVVAEAFASAYDTSLAVAGGVVQAGAGSASIDNAGSIDAEARARVGGEDGGDPANTEARAWAVSLGTGQLVLGDVASADVTNVAGADITVLADASAIDYQTATAGALGVGIGQVALGDEASATVLNEGDLTVDVNARASSIDVGHYTTVGDANALGAGVGGLQVALAYGESYTGLTNDGDISVDVDVQASVDGFGEANAIGVGLGVGQIAASLVGNASADLVNNDTIDVDVYAAATGYEAEADAFGIGALQVAASLGGAASASLTNTSPDSINVDVTATANGSYADANAYAFGAGQVVATITEAATADLYNEGSINVGASAYAFADNYAIADADAAGVNQLLVSFGGNLSSNLVNDSVIDVAAFASASGYESDAQASAGAVGVNQFGISGGEVSHTLTNNSTGSIDVSATANAFASDSADAFAEAAGAVQFAQSYDDVDLTASNLGSIEAGARAVASGVYGTSATYAYAGAGAAGVVQLGQSRGGDVTADLTNSASGLISAYATATAFAAFTASAYAEALGAEQLLGSLYDSVDGTIDNAGTIRAAASAYASSFDYGADAEAFALGAGQGAEADDDVTLAIVNSGSILADAVAKAYGSGISFADVDAYAEAIGVGQQAFAGDDAAVEVQNTSMIAANATAFASNYWRADASAAATGALQEAFSASRDASADLYNEGLLSTISGVAAADAVSGYSDASASAIGWGVSQDVYADAGKSTAGVTNDGSILGSGIARADAYDSAFAYANGTGIEQDVYNDNGMASAVLVNSGSVEGYGSAVATGLDYARASADVTGIEQDVDADNEAEATVDNSGLILANANASARSRDGSADADADAIGVEQVVNSDNDTATATVINTAQIFAFADAEAFSKYSSASASADATGIDQEADNVDVTKLASTNVTNSGTVSGSANAGASSLYDSAYAYAYGRGIEQNADGDNGSSLASVINTGVVQGLAQASATAYESASAIAYAWGIDQDSDADLDAEAFVDNSGTILAVAGANAVSYDSDADAEAYAYGIQQDKIDSDELNAYAEVINSGVIIATAGASATAYDTASASAYAYGIDQEVDAAGAAEATVDNTASILAFADARASALYESASATAVAYGIYQEVDSDEGTATAVVNNTGDVSTIYAEAFAGAFAVYSSAFANADGWGIRQEVEGDDGNLLASASVTNEGSIVGRGLAQASAIYSSATAFADGTGIEQDVDSEDGDALASVVNSGTVTAFAQASAFSYSSEARANADASGIDQNTDADNNSDAIVDNTGLIEAIARANAFSAYDNAYADADAKGVDQFVESDYETASALVENAAGATILADGFATAEAYVYASASVNVAGVEQDAFSDYYNASATVLNDGTITAVAGARAIGTGDIYEGASTALAIADAEGVDQSAYAENGNATSSVTNTSFLSIDAEAFASAVASVSATAIATGNGVFQSAFADDDALVETDNSGSISALAEAIARTTGGSGSAAAFASATGLDQEVAGGDSSTARLVNSGDIGAVALADAYGSSDYAAAEARGHSATGFEDLTLDVTNSSEGQIYAFAGAVAYDEANALAAGSWFQVGKGSLDGVIDNAGFIGGSAYADASTGTASAFGLVQVASDTITTTTTNSGIISAYAEGVNANATGIAIASFGDNQDPDAVATVNNEGGVIFAGFVETMPAQPVQAAIENLDGEPISRGNAINTRGFTTFDDTTYLEAPNAVVFNFTGGEAGSSGKEEVEALDLASQAVQDALSANDSYGFVFGNILITEDDELNFFDGATIFDGNINPEGEGVGTLNIFGDGKLVMVQNTNEGASTANVDELNVESDGTLVFELTPFTTEGFDYPQIFANTANIEGGNFVALYTPGFYGDTMFYDNVIDAETLNGEFGTVEDNSALLNTVAIYDFDGGNTNNVDLYVERIAFDEVAGMTDNQEAVGGAIENVYAGLDPDTDFGRLVANLFTLDDGDYQQFLNQLTGAEHAEHLRSVLWSTRAINRIITERMECDSGSAYSQSASATSGAKVDGNTVMPTADAPMASTGCFEPGTASIWMRGFGQWNTLDGDENAPGYDETQYGIIFGGDYAFDENWFLGIAGGYFNSDGEFDDWGGRPGTDYDYDGLQIAAYGGFDNSDYYLRGVISYGNYDGESNRLISFNGSPIDPAGDPSSNTLAFYGETGYRFAITDTANFTPFAGLSLAKANLDGFTEDDPQGTGAALEVHDSDANSIASVLGLRFDADMAMGSGIFTPTVSVAWMHEFGDTPEVDMSFDGAPAGADFTVVASDIARDSVLIDAGAKFALDGAVDFGLFYNGQFSADYSSNAITARLGYKF